METDACVESARGTAWAHSARDRGNLQLRKGGRIKVNRGRLVQRANDRITEFGDREKPKESFGARSSYSRD